MFSKNSKMAREINTIEAMINIYCRDCHDCREDLCRECAGLLNYTVKRLNRCPFIKNKPICSKCLVHCYKPEMSEKIGEVMRYAGPRMMQRHPILTLLHRFQDMINKPECLNRSIQNPKKTIYKVYY